MHLAIDNFAAAAAAAPAPATAVRITAGAGLIIIGLAAQYLIHKRLKNAKVSRFYSWIAWVAVVLGGAASTSGIGGTLGITGFGATVAATVMLLFIGVDIADSRPEWLAFILMAICPTFMRLSAGPIGNIYQFALSIIDAGVTLVVGAFGG